MMSVTHAAIACSGSALLLGSSSPWTLLLSVIGSQLPDIDTTKSIAGKTLYPIAAWFEARFPHRTITHCLLATLFLAIASLPLAYYYDWKHWLALPFGHLISSCSQILADKDRERKRLTGQRDKLNLQFSRHFFPI